MALDPETRRSLAHIDARIDEHERKLMHHDAESHNLKVAFERFVVELRAVVRARREGRDASA